MDKDFREKISYTICYALRHKPEEFGLCLDENGFCNIKDLLNGINNKYNNVLMEDIMYVVENDPKERFEIINENIRATYGHSLEKKIIHEEIIPPEILYHGTTLDLYENHISKDGLKHQKRQYVHLSSTIDTALLVAKRRENKIHVVLEIDSLEAYKEGIKFYKAREDIYLSDDIPSKYIKII